MRLVLISDTHLPVRAKRLPEPVWDAIDRADVVIHAGDWVSVALLDELEARAARLIGCWGNNDGPESAGAAAGGRSGDARRGVARGGARDRIGQGSRGAVREGVPGGGLLVFGHSHIPWDTTSAGGLRLLNPGSPTDRRRQPYCTYQTATITSGRLEDVALHNL